MGIQRNITKSKQPILDTILKRPRLFDALDNACSTPLTWINAPAGSGKSTLVSNYLETRSLASLWYNCSEEDNDLVTFFHYLGSFHKQLYPLQKGKLPRLQSRQQLTVTTFGEAFFHKLFSSLPTPSILVFDDFHCIDTNSQLHIILRNTLTYLPNGLSIFIISRNLLPSAYARLRVDHKISEVPSNEVMFTPQETEDFVRLMVPNSQLEKDQLEIWYNKTQGWVTGLILLLEQSRNDHSFYIVGDEVIQEHIFDYFAGEYFDDLKQTTKEFLVVTNLLTSFSSNQAQALTDNTMARQILHDMVSCQFITFRRDNFQTIYQFHPLLHEFLLFHLNEIYSDSDTLFLKNKAADLLADSGQLSDAATLYQQTNNHYALSQLLLKHAGKAIKQGDLKLLQSWVSSLPKQIIAQEPWLAYWLGKLKIQFNPVAAKPYFEMAINKFIQANEVRGAYLSWAGIANSYTLTLHTYKGARQWMDLLYDLRQRWSEFPDMETRIQVTFSALNLLTHISIDYEEQKEWVEQAEKLDSFIPGEKLHLATSQGLIIYNDVAGKIRKLASENYKIVTSQDAPDIERIIACAGITSSACITQLSDSIDALAILEKGLKIAEQSGIHIIDSLLLIQGIQLLLQINEIEKAKKQLHKLQQISGTEHCITKAYYYVMASHIEAEQGNHSTALAYLTDSLEIVEEHAAETVHELFFRAVLALQLNNAKNYDEAAQNIAKAEQLSLQLKSKVGDFMITCFKAHTALSQNDYSEAAKLLRHGFLRGRRSEITGFAHWRPSVMAELFQFALEQGIEIDYVIKLIHLSKIVPIKPPLHIPNWPWAVKIVTLGGFQLYIQGELLTFKRKTPQKPLELLKAIVALGCKDISIESLVDRLWSDSEGDAAKSVFDSTLQRLRKLLNDDKALILHDAHVSLNPLYCWIDTQVLDQVINEAHDEKKPDKLEQAVRRILELYQGAFLMGETHPWAIQRRQQLQTKVVRSLDAICKKMSVHGPCEHLDEIFERILEIAPYSEVFYQRLMQFYIGQGRMADSVVIYRRCEEVLEREFGVCPSRTTQQLHAQVLGNMH